VFGEGEAGVVREPRPLQQGQRLVVETAQVVVAYAAHLGAGLAREKRTVGGQRGLVEAVGVVAVQSDLAPMPRHHLQGPGTESTVRRGLAPVLSVRVPRDDVEGGRDAADVFAAQHARERPEGIRAARKMTHEPVGGIAELAAHGGPVTSADGACRTVAGRGEPSPRPSAQVVEVVGQRNGEALVAPHPARTRQRRQAELGEPRREHGAQERDVAVQRRLLDPELRAGGEHARGVGQPAVTVPCGDGVLVPAGQQRERRRDEVAAGDEAVRPGRGKGGHDRAGRVVLPPPGVGRSPACERVGRQRPGGGEEGHGLIAARKRRDPRHGVRSVGEHTLRSPPRIACDLHSPAQRREQRLEHPGRPGHEGVGRVHVDWDALQRQRRLRHASEEAPGACASFRVRAAPGGLTRLRSWRYVTRKPGRGSAKS